MLSLLALLPLLGTAFSNTAVDTRPQLDPTVPIYLGDVFWPPSMTFIAWLPSEVQKELEWCYKATDASNHALFSLAGVDALQIHEYFGEQAYITREGKRYADCRITPESGRIGACEGVIDYDCEGGHKFTGPGTRRWSCWVIPELVKNGSQIVGGEKPVEGTLTDALFTPTAVVTGAMSSEVMGEFTAGATGS